MTTARSFGLLLLTMALSVTAHSQSVQEKLNAALQMDYRTDAEKARDANRQPVEALSFVGLEDNMTVVEFFPARQAWYSKLLAPVLADSGKLYLIDSEATFERWGDLLNNPVFKNTHKVPVEASYNREEGRYNLGELNIPVNDADVFLNVREYHNFNAADKARLNTAAFNALKSGGRYVVIDHTRRHMAPETRLLGRREDPVKVILEVQAAGFVLEKQSDMFFKENDGLDLEVGNRAVSGQTDRFFLVFKKP